MNTEKEEEEEEKTHNDIIFIRSYSSRIQIAFVQLCDCYPFENHFCEMIACVHFLERLIELNSKSKKNKTNNNIYFLLKKTTTTHNKFFFYFF